MQDIAIKYISYFISMKIFVKFGAIVFVIFVDKISVTDIILSHMITEVSATFFKYLLFPQIHVLGFQIQYFLPLR